MSSAMKACIADTAEDDGLVQGFQSVKDGMAEPEPDIREEVGGKEGAGEGSEDVGEGRGCKDQEGDQH